MSASTRRRRQKVDLDAPQFSRAEAIEVVGMVEFVGADGEKATCIDYPSMAVEYAERCLDGRVLVGKWVKLAAKRFLLMRERARKGKERYYYDENWIVDVCLFLENLHHVEGWSGTIELEPWQVFVVAGIYAFRRKGSGVRLVRDATIIVPRKNAKSTLTAGLSFVGMLLEGEPGPTIYIGASTLAQAGKVFEPARKMIQKDSDFRDHYGLKALSDQIRSANGGSIEPITSVAEAQDGHNPHMVVLEELHAQKPGLYQVMSSALAARQNPLLLKITTAGRFATGLVWDQWRKVQRLLEGLYKADEEFAVIYTVDKEDLDPQNNKQYEIETIKKANPMWGISVRPENVASEVKKAIEDPTYRSEFLRTRLNVFSNAAEALFDAQEWANCEAPIKPDDFLGSECWIGVDLAMRNDMIALGIVFEKGGLVAGFVKHYIPADSPALQDPDRKGMYESWINDGLLTVAGEGYIDLVRVEIDLVGWIRRYGPRVVALDPSFAMHFASRLFNDGHPVVTFKNTAENMSEPTDDLRVRVRSGPKHFQHDGNPVLAWNAANVVGRMDTRGLLLPKKPSPDSPDKVDGIHALIFANACRMKDKEPGERKKKAGPHPWEVRGVLGFDEHGKLIDG